MLAERRPVSSAERLSYWFLRLNGFLILENFLVHPERLANSGTDADLLGVRFAHRSENIQRPMKDDPRVIESAALVDVVVVEVKRSQCALNGPWTLPEKQNMNRIIQAVGCFPPTEVGVVAEHLYRTGSYQGDHVTMRLMAFGNEKGVLKLDVPQILFDEMLEFIYDRFRAYKEEKSDIDKWAWDGKRLHSLAKEHSHFDDFRSMSRRAFNID